MKALALASFGLAFSAIGIAQAPSATSTPAPPARWALAIHGGAGVIDKSMPEAKKADYFASLERALDIGRRILANGGAALDAVEAVVRDLEDDPKFNAGKGAVFTHEGKHELDAAIMNGETLACGAVAGLSTVKNPISLARAVMEKSRHVFLIGQGAESFASEVGAVRVPPEFFDTPERKAQLQKALDEEKAGAAPKRYGTVGAVALDARGHLAAATSTGGMTNKRWGRVGDVPVIGAGTYANGVCAVSATGVGEQFIRHTVARTICARMEFGGLALEAAAQKTIAELEVGDGGVIAVGVDGAIALVFNSKGMFRGAADSRGRFEVKIWE